MTETVSVVWAVAVAAAGVISSIVVFILKSLQVRELQLRIRKLENELREAGGRIQEPTREEIERYAPTLESSAYRANRLQTALLALLVFVVGSGGYGLWLARADLEESARALQAARREAAVLEAELGQAQSEVSRLDEQNRLLQDSIQGLIERLR